jgi:3-oxoacyl-[acyl-carrier protein] reductase
MAEAALAEFGRLDVLVNNAGTTSFINHAALEQVGDDDWDKIFAVNVKGPFHCMRAVAPALKAAGSAEVVNVTSVAGLVATGSSIPYCASKAALNNMTLAMARVLAPEVRVNAVAPGAIAGRWLKEGWGKNYDAIMEGLTQNVPLRAVSTPQDVADAILSLITGSDLVTGQILVCDGGMMIR